MPALLDEADALLLVGVQGRDASCLEDALHLGTEVGDVVDEVRRGGGQGLLVPDGGAQDAPVELLEQAAGLGPDAVVQRVLAAATDDWTTRTLNAALDEAANASGYAKAVCRGLQRLREASAFWRGECETTPDLRQ